MRDWHISTTCPANAGFAHFSSANQLTTLCHPDRREARLRDLNDCSIGIVAILIAFTQTVLRL
jgi:hypothetical protein